jgi:microcystin-dependent protein
MSSPFVAEIRMFAGNFAPTGWALCDGQLLPISQNTALFSLLGTFYGGDGKSTFALPDLQGASPIHQGQGPGLSQRFLGEQSGAETITLLTSEMPLHNHSVQGNFNIADVFTPSATTALTNSSPTGTYVTGTASIVQMSPNATTLAGSSLPHNNVQPYLVVTFIIAMQGVFPART